MPNYGGNGKKYNTPNSTQNQTTQPTYRPEQAVVGTGMFRKGAQAAKGYRNRMRDRLKKMGY